MYNLYMVYSGFIREGRMQNLYEMYPMTEFTIL